MSEELNLVRDLAVILISAGIFTIISKALKQPLILGYILAGFLIGPNFHFFFGISSNQTVQQWSDIGIIFLMFGLGLEFSFKKLLKVGSSALLTAGIKFIGVFILGFVTAEAMDWSFMESIFLGGLLSMSSTMVVLKSYEDMGLKNKPYAGMVFGTLVVEDLIAILLMVLLSTMAVSKTFAGQELAMNIAKLVVFLILWFLVGIYVIPTLLQKARNYLNDEILLIVSLGLCFGMVALATSAGFSTALGAFVMGSILAETVESENISRIVGPIKNLFGAIFFVSVGMMLSPSVILEHWAIILLISVLVIVSHIVFSSAGIILSGKGLDNAVHTGFSLAQLGEFGFIIAGVGCTLGVMRSFIYPVIIAVSVITTFTTPFMIKLGDPCYALLLKKLPARWLDRLKESGGSSKNTAAEDNEWKKLLKAYFLRIVLYGVIITAIYIGTRLYLRPAVREYLPDLSRMQKNLVNATVTLVLMAPFLYGLGVSSGSISSSARKLIGQKQSNIWPIIGLMLSRSFMAIGIILGVLSTYFHLAGWTVLAIVIAGTIYILIARHSVHRLNSVEQRFMSNLNEKETSEQRSKPVTSSVHKILADYDVHTESIVVSPDSIFAGMSLKDMPLRAETGANIIKLTRGTRKITVPSGEETIYPGDTLLAIGTAAQLAKLKEMMAKSVNGPEDSDDSFKIEQVMLEGDSFLTGKTLRNTHLRDYGCMVVSVLHGNSFITNPEPDYHFEKGDTVWIAGDTEELGWS